MKQPPPIGQHPPRSPRSLVKLFFDSTTGTICCILVLFAAFLAFIPWSNGLEPWEWQAEYFFHLAFAKGWVAGKDYVFTYGPLAFCSIPFYHPLTFWAMLAFHGSVLLLTFALLYKTWRLFTSYSPLLFLYLALITGILSITPPREWSGALMVPYLLVPALTLLLTRPGMAPSRIMLFGSGMVLSVYSLIKFHFIPLFLLFWAVEMLYCIRLRRFPWALAGGFVGFMVGTMAPSFSWAAFPNWLWGSLETARGYRDTMSGPMDGPLRATCWLAFLPCFLLPLSFLVAFWRFSRLEAVSVTLSVGGTVGLIYLHGFVSGGGGVHSINACLGLLAMCIFAWPVLRGQSRALKWPARHLVSSACLASALLLLSVFVFYPTLRPRLSRISLQARGLVTLITTGTRPMQQAHEATLLSRLKYLPRELKQDRQSPILAFDNGFAETLPNPFIPYPTVAPYSAYTPYLAGLAPDILRSTSAPPWVLYDNTPPTPYYPGIVDNLMPLELACHYAPVVEDGFHGWFRQTTPLAYRLESLSRRSTSFGIAVNTGAPRNAPVWARITVPLSVPGKLVSLLFRSPQVWIVILCENRQFSHKLPLEMAQAGFILSPYLANPDILAGFCANTRKTAPSLLPTVNAFALISRDPAWMFKGPLRIELSSIRFNALEAKPEKPNP